MPRPTVAVVGAGVSGLTAAYLLRHTHEVTLFETEPRLGGHAHTHDVPDPLGTAADRAGEPTIPVDSGFIVHNDRTYPHLRRIFAELGIEVNPAEMSMSISCTDCGLQYAGGRGAGGILAQPLRLATDRRFRSTLRQVRRFHRRAAALLARAGDDDRAALTTFGQWLSREGFSRHFVTHYAIPLVSCVWSSGHDTALRYPAQYLFRFLDHHGMLSIKGSPQWFTVAGGSRTYVERIAAQLPDVRKGTPVRAIGRTGDGVLVTAGGDRERFDAAVIATHADTALAMLADPTDAEVRVLGAFDYAANETILHSDDRLLPQAPRARASWNYRMDSCTDLAAKPVVTYWMNRLQGHRSSKPHLVTLNATRAIAPEHRIAAMDYEHPVYTPESVAGQRELDGLRTDRTVFAGAYHGWGFHEDGCRSGVRAAEHLIAAATNARTVEPA